MVSLSQERIIYFLSIIDFDDDDSGNSQSKISNKSHMITGEKKPSGEGINAFD